MQALIPRKETGLTTRSYWLGEKSLRDPTLSKYFGTWALARAA